MKSIQAAIKCFVLICLVPINAENLQLGDACQLDGPRANGVCQYSNNCPAAHRAMRVEKKRMTICRQEAYDTIVCCPTSVTASVRPRPTAKSSLPLPVQKCIEYSQNVFRNATILLPGGLAIPRSTDECGHKVVPFIIGGTLTAPREFPHSAILGRKQSNGTISWYCGGTLVSSRYVMSAAHCFATNNSTDQSIVRLGEHIINDETNGAHIIDVNIEKVIAHPNYTAELLYNDIALLKLAHTVQLSSSIIPICLPTVDENPDRVIATGWGSTVVGGQMNKALMKVVLQKYTNEECHNFFQQTAIKKIRNGIIGTQFCAGYRNESRDTCKGDSGGPLEIYHHDQYCMYKQIGITSFGIKCGEINYPAVYTRVFAYVDWISSIIWAPGEDE